MPRSVTVTVVTANIGRHVSSEEARANIRKVARSFPNAFVGFQEIDEADGPDEMGIIGSRFPIAEPGQAVRDDFASEGQPTYDFVALKGPSWKRATPIGVPSTWQVLKRAVKKTSDGLAGVTPHRVVVSARCRPTDDPDFPPIVFLNGHYPRAKTPEAKLIWAECQESWKERAGKISAASDGGFTMITTRDTNKHGPMPKIHPSEKQLLPPAIDRISFIPVDPSSQRFVTVRVLDTKVVNLTIDNHDAHAVVLRLTAPNA